MDIETVIGCFREARLGRRMTAGLEGCERPAGDAGRAGGRSRCATESQPKQRARSAQSALVVKLGQVGGVQIRVICMAAITGREIFSRSPMRW